MRFIHPPEAKEKSWGGEWKSRMPGLRTVGVIVILLLAWENVKRKGGHTRKRVDMCGDP